MRKRLLLSTLAVVAVAVVLFGAPLAVAIGVLQRNAALDVLQRDAVGIQVLLNEDPAMTDPTEALGALAEEFGLRLVLVQPVDGGAVIADTGRGPLPFRDAELLRALDGGESLRVYRDGVLGVATAVRFGPVRQVLVALDDDAALREDVRRTRLAIVMLAGAALGTAVLAALWQGQRLAVPLEELAESARRLGDGDFTARAPRSGLPEADDVAAALDTTATRLAAMLERSRSFSADASHQLRTPLTALRLDLEALEGAGADTALLAAAYGEADRLEATIRELLELAAAPRGDAELDLAALAAQRLDAWRSLARAQGRQVVLDARPAPKVRAREAALGQSLQVLLDNALEYGAGTITVSVGEVAGGVRLCVADEGPGIPPEREDDLFRADPAAPPRPGRDGRTAHAGRGLPLARSLVEAEGGRIHLERARPGAVVCLLLPGSDATPAPPSTARSAVG